MRDEVRSASSPWVCDNWWQMKIVQWPCQRGFIGSDNECLKMVKLHHRKYQKDRSKYTPHSFNFQWDTISNQFNSQFSQKSWKVPTTQCLKPDCCPIKSRLMMANMLMYSDCPEFDTNRFWWKTHFIPSDDTGQLETSRQLMHVKDILTFFDSPAVSCPGFVLVPREVPQSAYARMSLEGNGASGNVLIYRSIREELQCLSLSVMGERRREKGWRKLYGNVIVCWVWLLLSGNMFSHWKGQKL